MASVAVFGAGDVGEQVLRTLAVRPEIDRLIAFDLNEDRLASIAANVRAMADLLGYTVAVEDRTLDMSDEESIAACLEGVAPDAIVNTATLQSWWAITQLPAGTWRKLEEGARFGPWLPLHLALTMKLMRAVDAAGIAAPVVNVAFPDAVNPVLARQGLAPACGAGNSEMLWTGARVAAARALGVPADSVTVRMVAHHFHVVFFWAGLESVESLDDYPFILQVQVDGGDVTAQLDARRLFVEAGRAVPKGRQVALQTAASAAKNVIRLLDATSRLTHVAAPSGLIGGYDAVAGASGIDVTLPDGIRLQEAQALNERAQRGDGIERIDSNGVVTFTDSAAETMREVLGYDCRTLHPDETEARADELRRRLRELISAQSAA